MFDIYGKVHRNEAGMILPQLQLPRDAEHRDELRHALFVAGWD